MTSLRRGLETGVKKSFKTLIRLLDPVVINLFHLRYRTGRPSYTFLGHQIQQYPQDLQIYHELAVKLRPAFVIETGVLMGGSVLYWATLLDVIEAPASSVVIGVDFRLTQEARSLRHPRIRLIEGSSVDAATVERVRALLPAPGGMVILDSHSSYSHVMQELRLYREFVAVGSYLMVTNTSLGHPIITFQGDGQYKAARDFLKEDDRFVRDDQVWKRNLISCSPYGWLKRVR